MKKSTKKEITDKNKDTGVSKPTGSGTRSNVLQRFRFVAGKSDTSASTSRPKEPDKAKVDVGTKKTNETGENRRKKSDKKAGGVAISRNLILKRNLKESIYYSIYLFVLTFGNIYVILTTF